MVSQGVKEEREQRRKQWGQLISQINTSEKIIEQRLDKMENKIEKDTKRSGDEGRRDTPTDQEQAPKRKPAPKPPTAKETERNGPEEGKKPKPSYAQITNKTSSPHSKESNKM